MPGKRGTTTLLDHLPEDIIDRILIRLPPKDVGRCRAVCTLWSSVTSTPEFMSEHHRSQPSLPIIDGDGRPASLVVVRGAGARTTNQQLWPFVPGFKHRDVIFLQGTCDGFIIVTGRLRRQFYICNPVLRQHALLPQPPFGPLIQNYVIGFYMHCPTKEYRVLWVSKGVFEFSLYVLIVGSDKPRHIRVRMPTVSSVSMEWKLLEMLLRSAPVQHQGNLYWRPPYPYDATQITGDGEDIIVFDTEVESFRWMPSPAQPNHSDTYHAGQLFDLKGVLAFSGFLFKNNTTLDVWMMQDYEAEIWTFKYRIDLTKVEASQKLKLTSLKRKSMSPLDTVMVRFNEMAVLNEHELLIQFNHKHVLHCDIDGKFLGMVKIGKRQYRMALTGYCLQESIIPIPSHEMLQEDQDPPFFTSHG
ncbi:putative F-box/kelch-repeat protein At1g13200 [Triticum dicoccoides]|uniref:putative F-box/kelch-repeat protein At1g13200 n=1 Tax=Triticum dicoccoides TaxID=85692 RepID=UPI0008432172|nr:putative F-box/kelch-repeat protein At1g13200 [Triticum dicoccoides]XP_044436179.1 putative F-box/kelch-repeat protein At1g13200 [Triticum aestivum]